MKNLSNGAIYKIDMEAYNMNKKKAFDKEEIIYLLKNPLEYSESVGQEWMIQGLGMLQLKLDDTRTKRIHIWDIKYQVPNHTSIHSHPWDFTSTVLLGSISNRLYNEDKNGFPLEGRLYSKITIKCGPEECVPSEPIEVLLEAGSIYTTHTGGKYSLTKDQIHSSTHAPGTITLIERSNHDIENKANIYYRNKWVSAEHRKATNEEVLDITTRSLVYMELVS